MRAQCYKISDFKLCQTYVEYILTGADFDEVRPLVIQKLQLISMGSAREKKRNSLVKHSKTFPKMAFLLIFSEILIREDQFGRLKEDEPNFFKVPPQENSRSAHTLED